MAASAIGASEWCQGSGVWFRSRRLPDLDLQLSWVIVCDCGDSGGGGGHNHICEDPLSCAWNEIVLTLSFDALFLRSLCYDLELVAKQQNYWFWEWPVLAK